MTTRRAFLAGLAGTVIAAPAIVRASSLMAIKPWDDLWSMDLSEASLERIFQYGFADYRGSFGALPIGHAFYKRSLADVAVEIREISAITPHMLGDR